MYICSLNVDNNAMASILCFNCRGLTGDFESAMWTAATEIFGAEVELRGCLFHWNQAIYRRIQDSGLQKGCHTKRGVNSFCKLIMALPFLPAEWIEPVFQQLKRAAPTAKITGLLDYVERQWISSTTFPIASWSVYKRPFRTNNDVEGWHQKLNASSRAAGLNMYKLIHVLHIEAIDVQYACRFVSEKLMMRCQRKIYARLHGRIFELWAKF